MINDLIKALRNKANELNQTADSLQKLGFMLGPLFVDDNESKSKKAAKAIMQDKFANLNMTDPAKFPSKSEWIKQWVLNNPEANPAPIVVVKKDKFNEAIDTYSKPERKTAKGFKYPKGTHWTQKPENAAKLRKVVKRMTKVNKELQKG